MLGGCIRRLPVRQHSATNTWAFVWTTCTPRKRGRALFWPLCHRTTLFFSRHRHTLSSAFISLFSCTFLSAFLLAPFISRGYPCSLFLSFAHSLVYGTEQRRRSKTRLGWCSDCSYIKTQTSDLSFPLERKEKYEWRTKDSLFRVPADAFFNTSLTHRRQKHQSQ